MHTDKNSESGFFSVFIGVICGFSLWPRRKCTDYATIGDKDGQGRTHSIRCSFVESRSAAAIAAESTGNSTRVVCHGLSDSVLRYRTSHTGSVG